MKKPKSSKSQSNKGLFLVLAFILLALLAAITAIKQPQQPRPSAKDYFDIKVSNVIYSPYTTKSVNVKWALLNITAIGGEATSITLQNNAVTNPDASITNRSHLNKGESWYCELTFENYVAQINDRGEIVLGDVITIGCKEAEKADITLVIPESVWNKNK